MRTAKEVLEDHLKLSKHGTVDEDVQRNYSKNVVMLTSFGTYKGHEGMKELAKLLRKQVPNMTFEYKDLQIKGNIGFLEWSANSKNSWIKNGADSYVFKDGLIVAQSIHYNVTQKAVNEYSI